MMKFATFARLLALFCLVSGAFPAWAAVNFRMEIWNGYNSDFYYPAVYLNNPTPAPVTYHRVESANGLLWRNVGTNNDGNGFFLTNDLSVVVNECTNGVWKLWLNKEDASEELYFFKVNITGVTPATLGGVQVFNPLNGSVDVPADATFHFTGPVNLPALNVQAYDNAFTYFESDFLPSTATNWTPASPMPVGEAIDFYINYRSNNHLGFVFSTPTNISGTPLSGWTPRGDIGSYVFSMFTTTGSSGGGPLGDAVDAPQLTWTTGGDAYWIPQTAVAYDGVDAAQSGAIGDDAESWIETTIEGPGTLSFWWKVSSDDFVGYDYLELTVNDNYQDDIAGDSGWQYRSIELDAGPNVVRWTYWKDFIFEDGDDAAWLDQVAFSQPVEVELEITLQRELLGTTVRYFAAPYLSSVSPAPETTHEVESPNGFFTGSTTGSGVFPQTTLQAVVDEVEAGDWTLYINRGAPSEQVFTFTVTVDALDETNLPPVTVLYPAHQATGVATSPVFHWNGPTNFNSMFVNAYQSGGSSIFASLPVTTTNWPPGSPLPAGTNNFYCSYSAHSFGGLSFSNPEDGNFNPLASWSPNVRLSSSANVQFVAGGAAPPAPLTLLTPTNSASQFSFALTSQSGFTHVVQYRTNLVLGTWQTYSNVTGDGGLKNISVPASVFGGSKEGFVRVATE